LLLLSAIDLIGLYICISVAILLGRPTLHGANLAGDYSAEKAYFVAAAAAAAFVMGLYSTEFINDRRTLPLRSTIAAGMAFAMLTLLSSVASFPRIAAGEIAGASFLSIALLWATRLAFTRMARAGVLYRRVLVIGAGEQAQRLERLERSSRNASFRCAGFLPVGAEPTAISQRRIVRASNLLLQCESMRIDEIVVAVADRSVALPTEDLLECRLRGIPVSDLSAFFERELGQIDVETLHPSWLIFSDATSGGRLERLGVKRALDVVLSLGLLLFTLPVTVAAAVAIFLEDGRPIFYKQERVGLNGRRFNVIKFRSMRIDAERDGRARWAAERDSRVTWVGAFIRRTRIDEIPQILNVLSGEMSLVGPRPERPAIIEDLVGEIPFYAYRHVVRPGITGWAQVNYPYGASVEDAKQKLKFDLYYVKNAGLLLDLVILMQTVRVVLWPHGVR
jgi:sugar transferase (PEP-CTERM system associated)